MIRRNVLVRKDRSIKWSLLAAAVALSLGFYAQSTLETEVESSAATAAVEQEAVAAKTETTTS